MYVYAIHFEKLKYLQQNTSQSDKIRHSTGVSLLLLHADLIDVYEGRDLRMWVTR